MSCAAGRRQLSNNYLMPVNSGISANRDLLHENSRKSVRIIFRTWQESFKALPSNLWRHNCFKEMMLSQNLTNEMFLRMLTVHCDQNNSYEITINGFQVINIKEIRNVIFGFHYEKPSSALRPKLGCLPSWVLDDIQIPFAITRFRLMQRHSEK